MPLVMENGARRVAVERLSNADRIWTDIALPYGNRVSLTLPADLFGRSVQVFLVPVQDQEAEGMADIPMDELSRSLAVLPDQYATGNWNGYGEKPLNRDSHRLEVGRQDSRPDQRGGKPPLHHAELTSWPQGDDEDAKLQRIDIATDLADASGYVARG